jgi:hypothetical protein
MNGVVVFGVALIIVGLFVGGPGLIPMLVGGVAVIAYGAFTPVKLPRPSDRPAADDRFI